MLVFILCASVLKIITVKVECNNNFILVIMAVITLYYNYTFIVAIILIPSQQIQLLIFPPPGLVVIFALFDWQICWAARRLCGPCPCVQWGVSSAPPRMGCVCWAELLRLSESVVRNVHFFSIPLLLKWVLPFSLLKDVKYPLRKHCNSSTTFTRRFSNL